MEVEPNYTAGDENEVECPHCDYAICLVDDWIDGCIESGYELTCPNCDGLVQITDVDYAVTVWCKGI
jgi:hypothetical protein